MPGIKRGQLFVEPKVQGALLLRTIVYWCTCVTSVALLIFTWRLATNPSRLADVVVNDLCLYVGPVVIASLLMLPLVMFDIMQLSNRFAGPLVRLRMSMRSLARGEQVRPIRFREGDFWEELAEEFNAVVARLDQERAQRNAVSQDGARSTEPSRTRVGTSLLPTVAVVSSITERERLVNASDSPLEKLAGLEATIESQLQDDQEIAQVAVS